MSRCVSGRDDTICFQVRVEMRILSLNFLLFTMSGVWRPIEWTSKCSRRLYSMFTFSTLYLLHFSMLIQFMDIVLVVDNMDDFATTALFFLSTVSAVCKAVTTVTRRSDIINLVKILQEEPCKPSNEDEINIQRKYDVLIRSYSISYTRLAAFSATGAVIGEILAMLQGELPYRGWVPYDIYTSLLLFLLTSLQEMLAVIFGTIVNVATETIVLGFCLQTCSQLEILKYRLQKEILKSNEKEETRENPLKSVSYKRNRLSKHIHYHLCIIRFAKLVNDVFNQVLFVQFFASIFTLCTSTYYLSSHTTVEDFVKLVIYTFCMFVQIFVYCWAGNEVILKSVELGEAVYEMDWILLNINEQKDLLMIMKRSKRPIKFTSTFLVTLSLESYGNILKASYSAFNVLQQRI
ncbi:PREDICTED: odorant receptor 46a, isoform B-like [Vollenhovia emeryi]|uniref:odorant receptor 46a, isoform B-like n=1 Tax=Vollenhovia emeryi TaxID=411798 RepID=UPI0005F47A9B|nr:PREDICTED: odorant receptor 46a, isoform B-like [Vollenhovia emeryi]